MQVILCKTEEDESAWTQYVDTARDSVFFQHIAWKRLIETNYGLKSHYLMALNDGQVSGILPLFLLKSPFFGKILVSCPHFSYGGICGDNKATRNALVSAAINLSKQKNVDYLELKNYPSPCDDDLINKEIYCTLVLDLDPNPQVLWRGKLEADTRNQVRKALKSGLTAELGLMENFDDYYRVLSRNMRDLGSPMDSPGFLRSQFQAFGNQAKIVVVKKGDTAIAAMDLFFFKDTVHVRYAGSIREYLQFCPNNLLWWKAIEYSCQQGYKFFDFGRSQWNSGTFHFKAQWGAKPKPLYYQYYLNNVKAVPEVHPVNPRYRLAINIWKKLPVSLANLLGSHVVKHIP